MPFSLRKYYPARSMIFFAGEGSMIFAAFSAVSIPYGGEPSSIVEPMSLVRSFLVMFIFQLTLYLFDLYNFSVSLSIFDQIRRVTRALGLGCFVLGLMYYWFPRVIISRWSFWVSCLVVCGSIALGRSLYIIALNHRLFTQSILVLGTGDLAWDIAREIENRFDCGYKIMAYLGPKTCKFSDSTEPFYAEDYDLNEICRRHAVKKIVVALDDRRGVTPIEGLINCRLQGIVVVKGISFYEQLTCKILVERVNAEWIIYPEGLNVGQLSRFNKRIGDIFLAILGLLLSFPIMICAAILIKLESSGSVFYRQERIGIRGESFSIIKFRSMCNDAEKGEAIWATANDSRVTNFGRIMRKIRIDELPQLWNVLKGEMSFVGPRPERPVFVDRLAKNIPYYSLRHKIKPGVTGWAQVCYAYGASEEDALRKLEYDLYYLKNISFALDCWIIFQTIKTVLCQKGAR